MTGRTIVYLPNWIGDMVMAEPFLQSLRASSPGELWGIGKTSAMYIYNGLDLFDRFVPYDRKGFLPFLDVMNLLKEMGFDRGVMLPHSFRSALLLYSAGAKERVGYNRNKRGFMLTRSVPEGPGLVPTVEHYLRIMDVLGGEKVRTAPALVVTEDEEHRFDQAHTDIGGLYVAFIVGAQYGPSKRWPDSHFARLADMIADTLGARVYLLPGKGEEQLARSIVKEVKRTDMVEIKSLGIRDLKVCLSRASAAVSNDTGPRHIAAALSVPTVVLIGPMDEKYSLYPSPHTCRVVKDIPCRPCNKRSCDRDHECLKGITPEDIFMKVENIMSDRSRNV